MEVMLGALPSLLPKLGHLLADDYNLQKEVKGGIMFLRDELESMQGALEHISKVPTDQLLIGDKIWARNVRELSYDIEDNIDTFMVQVKGRELVKKNGFKKFIDKALDSLMQPKIRRKIATDIRNIKSRVLEVHNRHCRYEVNYNIDRPAKVDPRALVRYEKLTNLVGINEARDEVTKILIEGNGLLKQGKIVSIVGFGGLGKTTLANVVYEELRGQFDCSAFVAMSQTPDMDQLFKDMLYQLAKKYSTASINNVINELREFLRRKRYFIIIDDIWEISYWNTIRCALLDDNDDYRIITTTRILTVAEQIGGAYKMNPLSLENSRILMYGRIFGKESKDIWLNEQLAQVSDRILKKCSGVPLVIITITSLLASKRRNKLEWYDLCSSIGAGLEDNNTVENMRKVLSLSYYDMPSHLRTCLLYFSMFPEDYKIYGDRLIRLWIAEGFIQSGKQEKSLFEIGESYLYELINRSMIQPICDKYSGMVEYCRVHDMVLDLVRSFSSDENFVTLQNGVGRSFPLDKVRRLSLQNNKTIHGKLDANMRTEHLRSFLVFPPAIDHVPTLQTFKVLRVLDLQDCDLSQGYILKYLGNLLHLRYLGLSNTGIDQLPGEIGNLRFLQTLEVWGRKIKISSLPSTIVLLTQMMYLRISYFTRIPRGIRSMIALEELSVLGIHDDYREIIEELGYLTQLKVLRIMTLTNWNSSFDKSLVWCLNKLHKIQSLQIEVNSGECNLDDWVVVAPQYLRRLELYNCWLSTLPAWVNPSYLVGLSSLYIGVRGLQQQDLEILGRLPALCDIFLTADHEHLQIHQSFTICFSSFPRLVHCRMEGFGGPVVFQQGAMPRLIELELEIPVRETREISGGFDLNLGNLLSLHVVEVWFRSGGASKEEMSEAKAAVMNAIELHPNHPTLRTY